MKPIIRVEGLGKQFRIGARQARYETLRESIIKAAQAPFRLFERNGKSENHSIWALKDVSFEVMAGEVVGIIGRNGAGKSTLLKILSRITEPTTGRVDLYGRVGSLLEVGTGFHPELSGRENIYLNGAILGMKRGEIDRKFDEIVSFAEIESFIDTPVKRYSSGMYMRLAFAVAAHLEPEILLVDEVLAVGDAHFQKKCLGKMREVGGEGRTVFFVSHNLAAIQQLCARTLLIHRGCVIGDGQTSAVITRYLNETTESRNGFFDLTNHPSRSGKFRPVIRHLTFYSAGGAPTATYSPEDSLIAEIYLKTDPSQTIKGPRVAFAIDDSLGRRIATVFSHFGKGEMGSFNKGCRVKLILPRLGLAPGRYQVSVAVLGKNQEMIDLLENAAWFDINWHGYLESGDTYHSMYGPLLMSSTWECIEE